KVTTVSDWWNPSSDWVEVTSAFVRGPGAVALQISAVPSCVFARWTSVQVRPAPETVAVWPPAREPSEATNATSISETAVLKGGVGPRPVPSTKTVRSAPKADGPGVFATITTLGDVVPMKVERAVAWAETKCVPPGVSLVSHEVA